MTSSLANQTNRLPWILAAIAGALLFIAFSVWGGIPTGDQAALFWAQVAVLFLVLCAFALLFWHLMIRPLAPNLRQPKIDALPARLCQPIAVFQAGGALAIIVGGVWDEIWHRQYGIPFGEDFFWPPHLLMYFGFLTFIGVGFWALHYLNRQLNGNFQQRFRSNPIIGILILGAAFMLYALATDPLWHWTFGEDLTAWSIPHLIMLLSFVVSLCMTVFIHNSTIPPRDWRTIFRLRYSDFLTLLALACCLLIWLQLMLIDWDATRTGIQPEWVGLFRPEWLLAANLIAGATFVGVIATRLMRCAGAATAVGLLALAIRFSLIQLFATDLLFYVANIVALLPLLAIDLWAYYCIKIRKTELEWRGTALAVIVAMLPNALVIRGLYNLQTAENLAYALAVVVTGIGMSWFSCQVANAMSRKRQTNLAGGGEIMLIKPQVAFGLLGGFALFMIFFIVTAAPPV